MGYHALLLAASLVLAALSPAAMAEDTKEKEKAAAVAADKQKFKDIYKGISERLKSIDANIVIQRVEKTEWDNVYMVVLEGGQILYTNKDSSLLFRGDMLKLEGKSITNLTENVRGKEVVKQLKQVNDKDMIVFSPKGEVKGVVYAFTDVDCGYCRKLHQEVPAMNAMGIEMRYLAFPRGGEKSPAYNSMQEAWCSADRKQSMTELKTGKAITASIAKGANGKPEPSCAKLVDDQYQLGVSLGVSGTPAMFLSNGQSIPGYRPAAQLAQVMGISPAPAPAQKKATSK